MYTGPRATDTVTLSVGVVHAVYTGPTATDTVTLEVLCTKYIVEHLPVNILHAVRWRSRYGAPGELSLPPSDSLQKT